MRRLPLVILAVASCFVAGVSFAQEPHQDGPRPYEEVQSLSVPSGTPVVLSQADPRWAGLRLGRGTVQSHGCLFISVAMIAMELGLVSDPLTMMRSFVMNGLFESGGRLRTWSIERVFPGLRVLVRTAISASGLDRIAEQLREGRHVLLKLDKNPRDSDIQEHWVRVLRSEAGDLIIADSNGGLITSLQGRYGLGTIREMLVLGN